MRFCLLSRIISERTQKDLSERSESMNNGASSYRRFLDGDDSGFVEIVRDYKDGLILYLNSFVNNVCIAEELAEETFVKLGIKKPKYKQKAAFRTWLYTIGRNVAIDYIRKNNRYNEISIDNCAEAVSDEINLEKSYIRQEQKISLHKAMRNLKPEYRQVLWLVYFEEFSNKEAAMVMRKSVHGIETLIYRAKLSLKSILDKEGFIYEKL